MKKPIILFTIEGLGLSAGWQGNPFASADPVNFYRIWNSYYHAALSPIMENDEADFRADPNINYFAMSHGKAPVTSRKLLYDAIDSALLGKNESLTGFFEKIVGHSSSLHLIGHLGSDQNLKLAKLIEQAKSNGVNRIYLHLLISTSFDSAVSVPDLLLEIEKEILPLGIEIATLGADSKSDDQAYQNILSGDGKRFLSVAQALKNFKNEGARVQMEPAVLIDTTRGLIHDFDGILLIDESPTQLWPIFAYFDNRTRNFGGLKFLFLASLIDIPAASESGLQIIFQAPSERGVIDKIEDLVVIAEDSRRAVLSKYLFNRETAFKFLPLPARSQLSKTSIIREIQNYSNILQDAVHKNCELLVFNISLFVDSLESLSFSESVEVVRAFDNELKAIEQIILKSDLTALIVSPFGGIERPALAGRSEFRPSENPLPFIIIGRDSVIDKPTGKIIELSDFSSPKDDLSLFYKALQHALQIDYH